MPAVEGKSTKRKSKLDRQDQVVEDVPPEVMSEYRNIHLDIDIMFVNGIPFLTTISRDLQLIHCKDVLKF